MKKVVLIVSIVISCLLLVSCSSEQSKENVSPLQKDLEYMNSYGNNEFVAIKAGSQDLSEYETYRDFVFVDRETRVMYGLIGNHDGAGITVLYDSDGKPRIYDGEFPEQ